MLNKQQINFILKIFFLLVAFIYLIKQESETNKCVDYSNYSKNSYSGRVVDSNDFPDLSFYKYSSTDSYQSNIIPIGDIKIIPNQSNLKFSIHYFTDNFSPIYLPQTQILKILQKKNICHKSSDDTPAPYVCC